MEKKKRQAMTKMGERHHICLRNGDSGCWNSQSKTLVSQKGLRRDDLNIIYSN